MEDQSRSADMWVRSWHVAPLWRVRRKHVRAVAAAHGVRSREQSAHGTLENTFVVYHLGDAQRLAEDLANGTAALDPRWRTGTPQGQRAARRDALAGCACLLLIPAVIAACARWR